MQYFLLLILGAAFAQQGAEMWSAGYKTDAQRNDAQHLWSTGPALQGDLVYAQCSFNWRDQCWGNKKGRTYLKCSNGQSVYLGLFSVRSGCNWRKMDKKVTMKCPKGQKLSIWYTVGGGGGHRIYLKDLNCKMRVKVTTTKTVTEPYQVRVKKTRQITVTVPSPPSKAAAGTKNDYSSTNNVKTWGTVNLSSGKKAIKISGSFYMKDQCWGNAKGRVYVNCGGKRQEIGFYAPSYRRNFKKFSFSKSLPNCTGQLKVEYVVGGGGGHRIYLKGFSASISYAPGSKQQAQDYYVTETRYRQKQVTSTSEKDQTVFTLADMVAVSEQTLVDMDNYYKALAQAESVQEEEQFITQEWQSEALFIGVADVEEFEEHMDATRLSYYHMAAAGALVMIAFIGGRLSLRSQKEYEPLV